MKNIFRKIEANESLILACLQIYARDFSPGSLKLLKKAILPLLT